MASEVGLNEQHTEAIVKYLRFARFKRSQRLKVVDSAFEDLKESRLTEETFTAEEVRDMMNGLCVVLKGDVESELIHTSHTNVLLLRQVFQQAEKWHLKLNADVSELENQDLIAEIARFEEKQFAAGLGSTKNPLPEKRAVLEPLNEAGGAALLHMEISRLKEENEKMKERVRTVEKKAHEALQDKGKLKADLEETQAALEKARISTNESSASSKVATESAPVPALSSSDSNARVKGLNDDLAKTKHELLAVNAKLEETEKELQKKFAETAQFTNLKKMLTKKNEQLKDLRTRLKKHEPDATD
eukprot:m.5985 g.5985  ORF g.5985 m.5985 type:complete len:303 (+) comp14637_c0_seq2:355-1263(+)